MRLDVTSGDVEVVKRALLNAPELPVPCPSVSPRGGIGLVWTLKLLKGCRKVALVQYRLSPGDGLL